MTLAPGNRIGPYEILGPIGSGGMGEVYRARDTKLKRDVALKVLPPSFASDPDRMARFQREAEVLASLNHPNIAAIYGVEDRALVMELVEGENLRGPVPFDTAINYASQIALALEAAHDKGIVHRDLKPANIKITPSGVVKVLDFGLAVAQDPTANPADAANSPTLTIRATQAGLIMGTAGYMSPEQASGKPVDKRADIWSFGVVLWEMLMGKKLFDGETVSHTLAAVLTKDPDFAQLPAATPPNVRRLLRRCLDRDLKRRLHDMGDAWIELNASDEPHSAPAAHKASRGARWLPGLAVGIIASAIISWILFHNRAPQPQQVIRWSFTQENPFGMPAISRDGSRMAYSEFNGGTIRIMLRAMDQSTPRPITGAETGGMPAFSPDGQWLAYFSGFSTTSFGTRLQKVSINGGSPVLLCNCPGASGVSWGDDHNIVFSDGKTLMRVPESGGTPQALTTPDKSKGEIAHVYPFVMPGGNTILFVVTTQSGGQIAALDVKTRTYRTLVSNGTNPQYVSAGYLLYVRNGTMLAVPFDAKRLAVTGPETPLMEGIGAVVGNNLGEYTVSDNGLLVYIAGLGPGSKSVLEWVDRKGLTQPLSTPQQWGTGRLSPEGLRVANSISGGGGSTDIWLFDVDRRTQTRLTFGGSNANPIWTPDGKRITYYGSVGDKGGIYSIAADGSGKPELLANTQVPATPSSWTPDGKTLLLWSSGTDKIRHIFTLTIAGDAAQRKPVLLHDTPFSESGGEISPDGRYVAYVSTESGNPDVYVQPFPGPGAKTRISTEGGDAPRWSRNGRELLYWNIVRTSLMGLDVQTGPTFHAGLPHEVVKIFSGTTWDTTPDGQRFLVEIFATGGNLRMETVVNWFDELRRRAGAAK